MKVKIGDQVYDANRQPIMLILSDEDKQSIADMPIEAHHYCQSPAEMSDEDIRAFMNVASEE